MSAVADALVPHPHLATLYAAAMDRFAQRDDMSVVVSGSLATGQIDAWSDLDLEIGVHDPQAVPEGIAWIRGWLADREGLLAMFPADHIGLADLIVAFFAHEDTVAKIDVWAMPLQLAAQIPGAVIVHDPGGRLAAARSSGGAPHGGPPPIDFGDLHHKMTGWCWYTATKIWRGELLEAADSLSMMRSRLVMCASTLAGAPLEGNRRLEGRLPPEHIALLQRTHPTAITPGALMAALLILGEGFGTIWGDLSATLGEAPAEGALDDMLARIRRV